MFYHGTFNSETATGNKAYTGVGFRPTALIIYGSLLNADGSAADMAGCFGFATSSTSRVAISWHSDDARADTVTSYRQDNTKCITILDVVTLIVAADLVSFDNDGFTLNWTTANATSRKFYFIAWGGPGTKAAIKQLTAPAATGNVAYTGIGFMPTAMLAISVGSTAAPPAQGGHNRISIGAATSASNEWMTCHTDVNAEPISLTDSDQTSTNIIKIINFTTSLYLAADTVSMDADGFTLNWSTTTSGMYCWVLCLQGGEFKVGQFTAPTSAGSQSRTGIGFKPEGLLLVSWNKAAGGGTPTAHARTSIGATSGASNEGVIWGGSTDAAGTSVTDSNTDSARFIKMMTEGTPTLNAGADFTSFDSDGWTENWDTASATAYEYNYIAFGPLRGRIQKNTLRPRAFGPGLAR